MCISKISGVPCVLFRLAESCSGVVNKHVTADATSDVVTMLYQVSDGPCDRAFGIHVAAAAGFPPRIITRAKRKATELEGGICHASAYVGATAPHKKIGLEQNTQEAKDQDASVRLSDAQREQAISVLEHFCLRVSESANSRDTPQ